MKITVTKKRRPLKTAAELQTPFYNSDGIDSYEIGQDSEEDHETHDVLHQSTTPHSSIGKKCDDEETQFLTLKDEGCALALGGNMGGALLKFKDALRISPNSHILHELMAQAYLAEDEFVEAQKFAKTATELCPTWSDGFLTLARTQREMGEIVNCMESYQRAVDIDPNNADALVEMEELKPILTRYMERKAELLHHINTSSTADEVEANTCIFNLASRVRVERNHDSTCSVCTEKRG
jgi:tetratricopeptide (TPR) repeat protein